MQEDGQVYADVAARVRLEDERRLQNAEAEEAVRRLEAAQPRPQPWPDPTPEQLQSPAFQAVWDVIKTWDIAVPAAYSGHTGAEGNHVVAILDGLAEAGALRNA